MKFIFFLIFDIFANETGFELCKLTLCPDFYSIDDYRKIVSINILSYLFETYCSTSRCIYTLNFHYIHSKRLYSELIPRTKEYLLFILKAKNQLQRAENNEKFEKFIKSIESIQYEKSANVTKDFIKKMFDEFAHSRISIEAKNSLCKTFFHIFVFEYNNQLQADIQFYEDVLSISHNFIGENFIQVNHTVIFKGTLVCKLADIYAISKLPGIDTIAVFNFRLTEFLSLLFIKVIQKFLAENLFVNCNDDLDLQKIGEKLMQEIHSFFIDSYTNCDRNKPIFIQQIIDEVKKVEFQGNIQIFCNFHEVFDICSCIEFLLRDYFNNNEKLLLYLITCFSDAFTKYQMLLMNTILDIGLQKSGNSAFMKNSMIRIYKSK